MNKNIYLSALLSTCFLLGFSKQEDDSLKVQAGVPDTSRTYLEVPTVTLEDMETSDESGYSQGVSPVLNAGRDPFIQAASFSWSISRFKIRGYDADYFETYVNGIPTEYIDNGFSAYNLWSGLNDVTRNRENSFGMRASTFAFGNIGGLYAIDMRASKQRKQTSITISASNRTYDIRGGATWGSGITKKGWSFSASVFGRWAKQGYVKGTYMQSLSYFASIEKFFKRNNSLALTAFGVPTKQGKAANVVQEAYDLAGTNYYNPNWGLQNGKVRNARVEYRHQPVIILTHEWKHDYGNLLTSVGYSFGERALSGIDKYKANDPRPDYYKYLPSYQDDSMQEALVAEQWQNSEYTRQVKWDDIYFANKNGESVTITNIDGDAAKSVTGKRAHYILGEDVQKYQRLNFNTVYNHTFKKLADLTAGASYQFQKVINFKRVKDLLGGDFYMDVDEYIESDSISNPSAAYSDLNNPNHAVYKGDKYDYNYSSTIHVATVWAQPTFKFKHVDFFVGGKLEYTKQWREGYFKNGLNPTNSEGVSQKFSYIDYGVKAGVTVKINGKNYIYANGMYTTRAPYWDNVFISPRTTNSTYNPGSEKIGSAELGYILHSNKLKLRATLFYTEFLNGSNTIVYFNDDIYTMINYTISGINKRHYGGELALEAPLYKGLSLTFATSMGQYKYTSRQKGIMTADDNPSLRTEEVIYSKNFNVANTPQMAYNLGLFYRSKKFWYIGAGVNFFDWIYTDFAPTHRTDNATDAVSYHSDLWYSIINQERTSPKGQWTLDMSGGYSWRLKSTFKNMKGKYANKYYLVINAGLSNITNNKKFIVSGREQMRFDYAEKDPMKFAPKYSYAYGINFYANLTFRF